MASYLKALLAYNGVINFYDGIVARPVIGLLKSHRFSPTIQAKAIEVLKNLCQTIPNEEIRKEIHTWDFIDS
jgi:hypothetical protein